MKKIAVGDLLPECTFESTDPNICSFKDLRGQNIVLYFYPKDNTPGCTQESKDFKMLNAKLATLNTRILGISRDSITSHHKFCDKLTLPFPLISDKEEKLCQLFGVLIEKNMFKRIFLGIERSTFVADHQGVLRHSWRNVKVKGHAEAVLTFVKEHFSNAWTF